MKSLALVIPMKKSFLLLSLFFVLLILIAPAVVGIIIRTTDVDQFLAPLAEQTQARVTRTEMQAGWLSSRMQFHIEHPLLQRTYPGAKHYVLTVRIAHGPWFLTPDGLRIGLAFAELVPARSGPDVHEQTQPKGVNSGETLSVLAGFQGKWQLQLGADSLLWTTEEDSMSLRGLSSTITLSPFADTDLPAATDIDWHLKIEHLASATPISSIDWHVQIRQLDRELTALYGELFNTAPDPTAGQTFLGLFGDRAALLLLQRPLQISSQIDLTAFAGNHAGDVAILWPGLTGLQHLDEFQSADLLRILQADLQITADEAALMRSPGAEALEVYAQQKLVTISNGQAKVNARLRSGTLVINDQSLPLDAFLSN